MRGDTKTHGSLFLSMGKIEVFWLPAWKPWEKQCQVQDAGQSLIQTNTLYLWQGKGWILP